MSLPTVCLVVLFSVEAAGGKTGTGPAGAETLARIDALYRQRDDRAALAEQRQLCDAAAGRAPREYDTLWRAARLYFWLSDDPATGNDERSRLGKIGWDYAERAIAVDAGRPEGHYWAAVNIGSYALGLGAMKALTMGLEDKFKTRLLGAGALAPTYNYGGVDVAWGRFYEKLPWPKRDRAKAEQHLRLVLSNQNPANLRARVFLADTLAHEHRAAEAKRLLDEVAAAPLGRYDLAEEHRAKALAAGLMNTVVGLMN